MATLGATQTYVLSEQEDGRWQAWVDRGRGIEVLWTGDKARAMEEIRKVASRGDMIRTVTYDGFATTETIARITDLDFWERKMILQDWLQQEGLESQLRKPEMQIISPEGVFDIPITVKPEQGRPPFTGDSWFMEIRFGIASSEILPAQDVERLHKTLFDVMNRMMAEQEIIPGAYLVAEDPDVNLQGISVLIESPEDDVTYGVRRPGSSRGDFFDMLANEAFMRGGGGDFISFGEASPTYESLYWEKGEVEEFARDLGLGGLTIEEAEQIGDDRFTIVEYLDSGAINTKWYSDRERFEEEWRLLEEEANLIDPEELESFAYSGDIDDEELLRRFEAGDPEAIEEVEDLYRERWL